MKPLVFTLLLFLIAALALFSVPTRTRAFPEAIQAVLSSGTTALTVTDNFNRADAVLTTPWVIDNGAGGNLQIFSNVVRAQSTAINSEWFYSGTTFAAAQYAQIKMVTNTGATNYQWVVVRGTAGGSNNGYRCIVHDGNAYDIQKLTAGSGSSLKSGSTTYSAGDTIYCTANGSTIAL
jgi:hypothetical protein